VPSPECAIPGKFFQASSNSCEDCPAGKFANATTHATARGSCEECPAGSFSGPGENRCWECERGRYATASGSSSCAVCPTGTIGVSRGLTVCVRCSVGKINDDLAMTDATLHDTADDCEGCGAGKFSSADRTECTACPSGTFVFNLSSCEYWYV
jgi:hypothetical protein